ncbi:ribosylnicotinamide kinase [Arachnomyces sp. PD_36]|nr:ribosylnicotinamide kinase [Arachnomyces sp. PD_36]
MACESTSSALQPGAPKQETIIVGISGPSSSGKTTIARLLRRIFSVSRGDEGASDKDAGIESFLVHEDDFYYTDDKIPLATTPSGELVQDWDTIDAIDVARFSSALSYIRNNGALPPFLKSKEDLNEVKDSGISDETVERFRKLVFDRLKPVLGGNNGGIPQSSIKLAFVEGFLLYAPPPSTSPSHPLRPIHSNIHIPLFLPATYSHVKARREGRSGYVTIGPPPKPSAKPDSDGKGMGTDTEQQGEKTEENYDEELPNQNFWEDPPGYVDDIVWPHYIKDHAWLLGPDSADGTQGDDAAKPKEGGNVREDVGVSVAPGKGESSLEEMLGWSVEEVIRELKEMEP